MPERSIDDLRSVPLPTLIEGLRKQARDMARCYGIPFYIYGDGIHQRPPETGPCERVDVPPGAKPIPLDAIHDKS
jgi:hypothetical protein